MKAIAPAVVAIMVLLGLGAYFLFGSGDRHDGEAEEEETAGGLGGREDRSELSASVARLLTDEVIAAVDDLRAELSEMRADLDAARAEAAEREKKLDARLAEFGRTPAAPAFMKDPARREKEGDAEFELIFFAFELMRTKSRILELQADAAIHESEPERSAEELARRLWDASKELPSVKSLDQLVAFRRKYPEIR